MHVREILRLYKVHTLLLYRLDTDNLKEISPQPDLQPDEIGSVRVIRRGIRTDIEIIQYQP